MGTLEQKWGPMGTHVATVRMRTEHDGTTFVITVDNNEHSDYDDDLRYVDSYCIDPDQILLSAQEMLKPAVEVFFITITTIITIIIIDTTPLSRLAYKSVN